MVKLGIKSYRFVESIASDVLYASMGLKETPSNLPLAMFLYILGMSGSLNYYDVDFKRGRCNWLQYVGLCPQKCGFPRLCVIASVLMLCQHISSYAQREWLHGDAWK